MKGIGSFLAAKATKGDDKAYTMAWAPKKKPTNSLSTPISIKWFESVPSKNSDRINKITAAKSPNIALKLPSI